MKNNRTPIKYEHLYFPPNELYAITMGLALLIQDFEETKNENWTPESRKTFEEIKLHAQKAAIKIERVTGVKSELPDYNPGDENEFLNQN